MATGVPFLQYLQRLWAPFLETPGNFPGPKTILGAQYSRIAIQLLLILKAKFTLYNLVKHITKFAPIITISSQINDRKNTYRARKVIGSFEKRAPGVMS